MKWLFILFVAQAEPAEDLASRLGQLSAVVIPPESELGKLLPRMLYEDALARIRAANERESHAWREIKSREGWEKYRDTKVEALRASLGTFPPVSADLKVKVTRTLQGAGYRIENLVFESRPGLLVTANLYSPAQPPA